MEDAERIAYLEEKNGELCAEINRQEMVIRGLREKSEMYRRQLGGMTAAKNRLQRRIDELEKGAGR